MNAFLFFFTKQKQQNIKQESHSNAVTNLHISSQIKKSSLINFELTDMFNFCCTINEWKSREELEGKRKFIPHKIKYLIMRTIMNYLFCHKQERSFHLI